MHKPDWDIAEVRLEKQLQETLLTADIRCLASSNIRGPLHSNASRPLHLPWLFRSTRAAQRERTVEVREGIPYRKQWPDPFHSTRLPLIRAPTELGQRNADHPTCTESAPVAHRTAFVTPVAQVSIHIVILGVCGVVVRYTSQNYTKSCRSFRIALHLSDLSQTSDGRSDGSGGGGSEGVGSSGVDLLAGLAVPDADGGSLDSVLQ